MKNPIKWHEECLRNHKNSLERKKAQLVTLAANVERLEQSYNFAYLQLFEAKAQGKDGFDSGRFLRKRKEKAI